MNMQLFRAQIKSSDASPYRPDIDGLRAIAVLSVIAFHYGFGLKGGFVGVDVFFVISGYLVGSHVYEASVENRFSYTSFYARRAKRILPALISVLLITFCVLWFVAGGGELRDFGRDGLATIFSMSNFTFQRSLSYFRPTAELNPLLMTWSLGIEEQFYILVPFAMTLIARFAPRWRLAALGGLAIASFALAVALLPERPAVTFFLLPTRAWELAAGTLLGAYGYERLQRGTTRLPTLLQNNASAWLGLILIVSPVILYDSRTPFPGIAAAPPVLGTVLLLASQGSMVNKGVLSHPILRWFGLMSYSLYLWHWPLISIARMISESEVSLPFRCGLALASLILANLSYRYIETPFRLQATRPPSTTLIRYAQLLAISAAVTGATFFAGGFPQRWSPELSEAELQSQPPVDPCLAGYHSVHPNVSAQCTTSTPGKQSIALVGDSHAAALNAGIRELARANGMGFVQLTKASCPFLVGVSRQTDVSVQHATECSAFNREVLSRIQDDPAISTVIMSAYWRAGLASEDAYVTALPGDTTPPVKLLEQGLTAAIWRLQGAGKQVVVIRDVPYMEVPPIKRARSCAIHIRAELNSLSKDDESCTTIDRRRVRLDDKGNAAIDVAINGTRAIAMDLAPVFCNAKTCQIRAEGNLLYIDEQHLSPSGAKFAVKSIELSMSPWPESGG